MDSMADAESLELQHVDTGSPRSPGRRSVHEPESSTSDVMKQCDALTTTECVDKPTALSILKLYHTLDILNRSTVSEKDREIEKLRNELRISQLTHTQVSRIEAIEHDMGQMLLQLQDVASKLSGLSTRIDALDARVPVTKRR